jgi:hypothetical protein
LLAGNTVYVESARTALIVTVDRAWKAELTYQGIAVIEAVIASADAADVWYSFDVRTSQA